MKKLLLLLTIPFFNFYNAQFMVNIETSPDFISKEAILYTLNGSKDIIHSKELKVKNKWNFKVSNRYFGMFRIYFPDSNNSVTFISENKDVNIKIITTDKKIKEIVYLDPANQLMEKIQDTQKKNEYIFPALIQIKEYYKDTSTFGKSLSDEIKLLSTPIEVNSNEYPFTSYYKSNYDKFLVQKIESKDSELSQEIFKFIVNTNEMLETSSLLRPLLVNYLNSGGGNTEVEKNVDLLLQTLKLETPRGQVVLSELIEIFDSYGMDNYKKKYLSEAKNLKCSINDRLAETIKSNAAIEIGSTFVNYKFVSPTNTKAKTLYDVKSKYKVVVFWSSTCSHCETELPVLLEKYNKLKDLGVEIVGLSLDNDEESYKKKAAIFPWVNDSELRGWDSSVSATYSVKYTPAFFILDQNNKIIDKPNNASFVLSYFNIK